MTAKNAMNMSRRATVTPATTGEEVVVGIGAAVAIVVGVGAAVAIIAVDTGAAVAVLVGTAK